MAWDERALAEFKAIPDTPAVSAIKAVVHKLRQQGAGLASPHAKPLTSVPGLYELRPRGGQSKYRLLYVARPGAFRILAVTTKAGFKAGVATASARAKTPLA